MCGYQSGPQENWLITQFINTTSVQYDFIVIQRRYIVKSGCNAAVRCHGSVEMYVLQTNETSKSFALNVSNFNADNKVEITPIGFTVGDEKLDITPIRLHPFTSGLYVALKDLGTCMNLTQFKVYVTVCDALDHLLSARFLNTAYPEETSFGSCLSNMATDLNATNGTFQAICEEDNHAYARWMIIDNLQCMCLPGYIFTSRSTDNQCQGGI